MLTFNRIPAIRVFDGVRAVDFCFSTSKNTVLISIEKSDDHKNDNRHKHPIRNLFYSTNIKKEDCRNNPH